MHVREIQATSETSGQFDFLLVQCDQVTLLFWGLCQNCGFKVNFASLNGLSSSSAAESSNEKGKPRSLADL